MPDGHRTAELRSIALPRLVAEAEREARPSVWPPHGWQGRLVPVRNRNTRGATGLCLEVHDLVLAKAVAGREKDWAFADEALRHGLVRADELRARLPELPLPADRLNSLADDLEGLLGRAGRRTDARPQGPLMTRPTGRAPPRPARRQAA